VSEISTERLAPAIQRYPMRRAGGAFLICIGAGLIAAIALRGDALVDYRIFFIGATLGVVSLLFARRLSAGPPTRGQIAALIGALVLEVALFALMGRLVPRGTPEHVRWLWVLAIVGVHFLPMSISFGARFLFLGAACLANAAAGLVFPIPFAASGVVDGALKLGVGLWSISIRRRC
jgi:hypothetical protein